MNYTNKTRRVEDEENVINNCIIRIIDIICDVINQQPISRNRRYSEPEFTRRLLTTIRISPPQFSIVVIQWFQILIHISRLSNQPQVKSTEYPNIPAQI